MAEDVNYSWAEKGRRESLQGIVDQLRYHEELGRDPAIRAVLVRRGFGEPRFDRMSELKVALDSQEARRNDARDGARLALTQEQTARTELKKIKRDIDSSLPDLFADYPDIGVTADAFLAGTTLGNSTPKISGYFAKIADSLQKVSEKLAEYNDGRDLYAEAMEAKKRLDAAQAAQEVGVRQLPLETLKILALKGEALELIERLNRAGKRGFEGQAQQIALFNKDLILRSRKTPPKKEEPAATGT